MSILVSLKQAEAFARQDGIILSLVWVASFVMLRLSPQMFLGNILVLSTPFIVAWRLKVFRNDALDGVISFRRAFVYSFYTFFYASFLFCICQYLYFKFLDGGAFIASMISAIDSFTSNYMRMGMTMQDIALTKEIIQASTAFELAMLFMLQNLLIGVVLSIFIAAFGMKRRAF